MYKYLFISLIFVACSAPKDETERMAHERDSLYQDSLNSLSGELAKKADEKKAEIALNDTLNTIAGLLSGNCKSCSLFPQVLASPAYTTFANGFSEKWIVFDSTRLAKLKAFRDTELTKTIIPQRTLFYPFSGPDILHANTFFPQVDTFILFGLEPVGTLPDFATTPVDSLNDYFKKINTSLNAILKFSFFRTESMSKDLRNEEVDGTVHLLFLFLNRTGNGIVSARPITIDSAGSKKYLSSFEELKKAKLKVKGVEIGFKSQDGKLKQLNYFSFNAADPGLKDTPGMVTYLKALKNFNTYLKGASYLLHKDYFSIVRDVILNGASTVVQDDSGIAMKYFLRDGQWDYTLFGEYTKPISLFKNAWQKSLDSLYEAKGSTNLGFGIGYNFKDKNSNLMIAKRK